MNTQPTPRTDEAAVDVWRKSNGERMATSSDKVDADFARKLERELNEARFDLDFSRRLTDWQSKTIDGLTAQRDEARETIATMEIRHAAVMLHTQSIVDEANQFREQRDRLAEALQDLIESCNCIDSVDFMPVSMPEAFEKAQQALQSLTLKP
jgi:hypothetical protein